MPLVFCDEAAKYELENEHRSLANTDEQTPMLPLVVYGILAAEYIWRSRIALRVLIQIFLHLHAKGDQTQGRPIGGDVKIHQ